MQQFTSTYFDPERSIACRGGGGTGEVLSVVAARYMGQNAPVPFQYRAFCEEGFRCLEDGRFDLNLMGKLPDAKREQVAYVAARFWRDEPGGQVLQMSCYGPVRLWINGEEVFRSSMREEVNAQVQTQVNLSFQAGWNHLVLRLKKVASGFGCLMGPYEARQRWITFLSPFAGRLGQAGFVYSQAVDEAQLPPVHTLNFLATEEETGLVWFPHTAWPQGAPASPVARVFPRAKEGETYLAWSSFCQPRAGKAAYRLLFPSRIELRVWLDGVPLTLREGQAEVAVEQGEHQLLCALPKSPADHTALEIRVVDAEGRDVPLALPARVHGAPTPWLYLGPLTECPESPAELCRMDRLFGGESACYWRLDAPGTVVRPYLENRLFARWNYPLGVTLYGLLRAARLLDRGDIAAYVRRHIRACVDFHAYSLWDEEQYGFAEVNAQLVHLKMLDDCGSFGNVLLEEAGREPDEATRRVAERIARHMARGQERRPDGAYYRELKGYFMEDTLWVDDLYMCTPFLCRYARLTGDASYLDEAVRQFLRYRAYLWMPEAGVMSHVYDFKHRTATGMPWGRGNGWCLFSLSELLEFLPVDHPERGTLLSFFNAHCEGIAAQQAESGLWRQLLTYPEAYEESSCTAMFVYAFCRGLRFSWVEERLRARIHQAARAGWKGLVEKAIDSEGNVYGICAGSCYAFTPDYYLHELGWVINDPHGTGIVMLAGLERMLLEEAEAASE